MKRLFVYAVIGCLLAILLSGVVSASDTSDALYAGTVKVTNNGTAVTGVATTISGINATSLIAAGFLSSSANDSAILRSGADVAYMPGYGSNPWILYVASIGEDSNFNDIFYTPNVHDGKESYFPGEGGLTTSGGASLELGDNFTFSMTGRFDENYSGYLVDYQTGLSVFSDGSGNYTLSSGATVEILTDSDARGTGTTIPVSLPADLEAGELLLIVIDTYHIAAGYPTITTPAGFTQLFKTNFATRKAFAAYYKMTDGTESDPVNITTTNSYYAYRAFRYPYVGAPVAGTVVTGSASAPDPPSLTSGFGDVNTLWIAVSGSMAQPTDPPTNYTNFQSQVLNSACVSYADREYQAASENPGAFTSAGTDWASNTIAILQPDATTITLNGVSSGENMTISADTTNLNFSINGNTDSTPFTLSIPPLTADLITGSDNTAIYLSSQEVIIDGVQKQYIEWEYGTTFTDQSGNGNDATPTFRTTSSDADVSANLIDFYPISASIAPGYTVSDAEAFISGAPNITGNFSTTLDPSFPGSELVKDTAEDGGTPVQMPFVWLACIGLVSASFLTSAIATKLRSNSILPKVLIVGILTGALVGLKVFDFWMLLYLVIPLLAFAIAKTHTTWGGESGYNMAGFLAMSFVGMTIINRIMEGAFLSSTDVSILNNVLVFRPVNVFGLFQISVPNMSFLTSGLPHLIRWDYSFFGGNAVIIQYLFYSITAFMAFLLFIIMLGVVFNMLSRSR